MADQSDGLTLDPLLPPDVQTSPEGIARWTVCVNIAKQLAANDNDQALEVREAARRLYDSPIPTEPASLEEADLFDFERLHPRDRTGEFAHKSGEAPGKRGRDGRRIPVKMRPLGRGPATPQISLDEIEEMGLNRWPKPTAATAVVLGDAATTAAMWQVPGAASPGTDSPAHAPYRGERRTLHDQIVGIRLAAPVGELLGAEHPVAQKLAAGQRLDEAERQQVRDAAAAAREGDAPDALFMAGGPASGKSSVLEANPTLAPPQAVRIDCDSIKDDLPEYQALRAAGDHYAASAAHLESGDIAARLAHEAGDLQLNLVLDGTGNSERGAFARDLTRKHGEGYDISVIYATTSTDEAVRRAVVRAEETGRFVPVPVIRDQHAKVSANFDDVAGLGWLASLDVFDDSGHIGTLRDGEFADLDAEAMTAFRSKAAGGGGRR